MLTNIFNISARRKDEFQSIENYLNNHFSFISFKDIKSVFGFVDYTNMYGGRIFFQPEISQKDVIYLYDNNIGLELPLTNQYITYKIYKENKSFLKKYHYHNNIITSYSMEMAYWIKNDFPNFLLKSSVTNPLFSSEDIELYFNIFDYVVLPAHINNNISFLNTIKNKDRIILFANSGCAYNCPEKICYEKFSKINMHLDVPTFTCSKIYKKRKEIEFFDFDLNHLNQQGFFNFKILRKNNNNNTGF